MDTAYLRNEFLTVKGFLKELSTLNPRRNASKIYHATEKELDILIKILHLVCIGKISLRKSDFEAIKQSKRLHLLKSHFETKSSLITALKKDKSEKVTLLKKFCALYSNLLYTMFNQI